jgi:class 3 adenylate cyclase
MPAPIEQQPRVEMAHVLFMDLVGYSRLPLEEQNRRVGAVQEIVLAATTYQRAQTEDAVLSHPAGDGMALAFFHDPSSPAQCALEIAEATRDRDDLPLRMGIHSGPVYRAEDINSAANVRGPGINLAQRVMDCGDAGHILLSYTTADALLPLAAWEGRLHDLGEAEVKHGLALRLYSLVDGRSGAADPQSGCETRRFAGRRNTPSTTYPLR